MSELKTFMSLTDAVIAEDIVRILNENKISFKVQDTSKDFDASFANDSSKNSILIMLMPEDFEKASLILEQNIDFNINEIDKQHPFWDFKINELKDVVKDYDEWHPLDVKFAKHLLEKENITVDKSEIEKQQIEKVKKAAQFEKSDMLTLSMGYLFCMLGGIAGIGIAIFLLTGKKKLPDGSKKYVFSKSDRMHGFYMLLLGTLSMLYFIFKYT